MKAAVTTGESSGERTHAVGLNVERIRADFPILHQAVHDRPLVYLDNAATTQKPSAVIDAISGYYRTDNANIHRGVHELSVRATDAYEQTRRTIQRFIGAARPEEIIFTRGATEAINLVAQAFGRAEVGTDDEIIVSGLEHHSNIVPWQLLCEQTGAKLRVAPLDDNGDIMLDAYRELLGPRTKMVAVAHISNALGTVNPIAEIIAAAREHDAVVLIDGAQAVAHASVDVQALDCDFYAFSGHKMFGPTGIGVLYGKYDLLNRLPPYQGGGDMISAVTFEKTTYNELPYKFEAGTPNIAGVIGLGAAVEYINGIGLEHIAAYEHSLLAYATDQLRDLPGVRLIGTAKERAAAVSFVIEAIHPHDIGTILDREGIAIRTGHHCAQPVMDRFGVPATARASFALYNTRQEIDALLGGVRKVVEVFT